MWLTCSWHRRECAVVSIVSGLHSAAIPITDASPQIALKARAPMQIIQALSISNVNTRRISEATEHLAKQRIMTERISEAKKVYEE